ncbi:unnamed protein product [Lactuca virosa]|uniref:Uncharacterized protein n=1 Tax=Lactuca virosa TaxID=75947 RepID=A0AAU9M6Q5_9ASTR|nr:unnamed protein product [Lactuca virosa]
MIQNYGAFLEKDGAGFQGQITLTGFKNGDEEPGGQRALIFDQGNRISQGISCADVADVCEKALHDSTARNKSFDIWCSIYQTSGAQCN